MSVESEDQISALRCKRKQIREKSWPCGLRRLQPVQRPLSFMICLHYYLITLRTSDNRAETCMQEYKLLQYLSSTMLLRTIFPALVVGLAGIAAAVPLSNDGLELLNITLPPDYDVSGKR